MEGYKDVFGPATLSSGVIYYGTICSAFCDPHLPWARILTAPSSKLSFSPLLKTCPTLMRNRLTTVCAKHFEPMRIFKNFLKHYQLRSSTVRRDELRSYLRCLHPFALSVMITDFEQRGIKGIFRDFNALRAQAATMMKPLRG